MILIHNYPQQVFPPDFPLLSKCIVEIFGQKKNQYQIGITGEIKKGFVDNNSFKLFIPLITEGLNAKMIGDRHDEKQNEKLIIQNGHQSSRGDCRQEHGGYFK